MLDAAVLALLRRAELPQETIDALNGLDDTLKALKGTDARSGLQDYTAPDFDMPAAEKTHAALALETGVSERLVELYHLALDLPGAEAVWRAGGYEPALFEGVLYDLRVKTRECMTVEGLHGVNVFPWYRRFYLADRFPLGRLQYERTVWKYDPVTVCGQALRAGDPVLRIHIPGGAPLSREAVLDSLHSAYAFFGCGEGRPLVLSVASWLIAPFHRQLLPPESNIVRFTRLFRPVAAWEQETFHDAWRIFGMAAERLPLRDWPEDTALRRAYKRRLLDGGRAAEGCGVLVYDGQRVLTEED